MKNPILFLTVLMALTAQAQLEEPSLFPPSRMQMHRVNGITATQYLISFGTDGKTHADSIIGKEEYLLDAEGRVTRRLILPGYSHMPKRIETRYDSLGRKIHLIDELRNLEGKVVFKYIMIWSYLDGMKPHTKYEYLAQDSGKSVLQSRIVYDYDDEGRTVAAHHIVGLKDELQREVIEYQASGREWHRWIQGKDTTFDSALWVADNMGRLVMKNEVRMAPDDTQVEQVETEWRYDDLGFLREMEILFGLGDGEVRLMRKENLFTYQYDAEGLLVEEIRWHFPEGFRDYIPVSVTRFEYERN